MKYLKKTLEYLFVLERGKRFLVLFLLALPIGAGAAVAAPNWVYTKWLQNYSVGDHSFWHAWQFGVQYNSITSLVAVFVTLILMLFFLSAISTVVARSLRVGVFKVGNVFREANETFFPILYASLTYILFTFIAKFLLVTLMLLFQNVKSVILSAVLSSCAVFVTLGLICFAVTLGILYLPYMSFNGLKPFNAFTASASRVSGKIQVKLFFAVFIPIILNLIAGALIGLVGNRIVSFCVETVLYTISIVYLLTLAFISYYEISELKREDYPREYFFAKQPRSRR